jgi:hypothetical protein
MARLDVLDIDWKESYIELRSKDFHKEFSYDIPFWSLKSEEQYHDWNSHLKRKVWFTESLERLFKDAYLTINNLK